MLEKTKFDKMLPRILKRGNDQGKDLAQKVLDNAANVTKQKITAKPAEGQRSNGVMSKAPTEQKDAKREQSDDSKKASVLSSKGLSTGLSAKSVISPAKIDSKSSAKTTSADAATAKTKANISVTKPTGFFAALKSASKKPGTSAKSEESKTT